MTQMKQTAMIVSTLGLVYCAPKSPQPNAMTKAHESAITAALDPTPPQKSRVPPIECLAGFHERICFARLDADTTPLGAQATDPEKPNYDVLAQDNERPSTQAAMPTIWVQTTEVSRKQVAECRQAGFCRKIENPGHRVEDAGLELPATSLTVTEANEFCEWVGGRLPTEDEWEFAAHGNKYQRFPWGNYPVCPYRTSQSVQAMEERMARVAAICPAANRARQTQTSAALQKAGFEASWLIEERPLQAFCATLHGRSDQEIISDLTTYLASLTDRWQDDPTLAKGCSTALVKVHRGLPSHPNKLLGLAGNASEMVLRQLPGSDQATPVLKGGSALAETIAEYRIAPAVKHLEDIRLPDVGFRCVREARP